MSCIGSAHGDSARRARRTMNPSPVVTTARSRCHWSPYSESRPSAWHCRASIAHDCHTGSSMPGMIPVAPVIRLGRSRAAATAYMLLRASHFDRARMMLRSTRSAYGQTLVYGSSAGTRADDRAAPE